MFVSTENNSWIDCLAKLSSVSVNNGLWWFLQVDIYTHTQLLWEEKGLELRTVFYSRKHFELQDQFKEVSKYVIHSYFVLKHSFLYVLWGGCEGTVSSPFHWNWRESISRLGFFNFDLTVYRVSCHLKY